MNSYTLFRRSAEFYKVMYAAADLVSPVDSDVVILVGANSPLKIWLNDRVLATSRASSVGHDPDIRYILPVHLKHGSNPLLVKMFCFPLRNEFSVRVGSEASVRQFIQQHGALRDIVEEAIVPQGKPFLVSENLQFFDSGKPAQFAFRGTGEDVKSVALDLGTSPELSTTGLPTGLYELRVKLAEGEFKQRVYVGDSAQIYPSYESRCAELDSVSGSAVAACSALVALKEMNAPDNVKSGWRLDWQKRALFYASSLEWDLRDASHVAVSPAELIGTRLVAYRSRVDGQVQHYLLHVPGSYNSRDRLPLVVYCPHNSPPKPFLTGPEVSDVNWIEKMASFGDQFGFAVLWPNARGLHSDAPLAFEDTFEAIEDAIQQSRIDAARVYLIGEREGAALAIGLAESYLDRFAAVSAINASSQPKQLPTKFWRSANSTFDLAGNLRQVPLLLIHGQLLPGSPSLQSQQFQAHLKTLGIESKLVLLPGDTRWADQDPFRLSFEFFKDKARTEVPAEVTFITGQLKHDSSYWVRVKDITQATQIARVEAKFTAPDRVEANTENVAALEINARMLAKAGFSGTALTVCLNGKEQRLPVEGDLVKIQISPAPAAGLHKGHEVEGPVSHAFAGPFLLVGSSQGPAEELKRENAVVDLMAKNWLDTYFVPCRRKLDKDVTEADIRDNNLVLIGTAQTNSILQRIAGHVPLKIDAAGVKVGDASYAGKDLSATIVYPNPLNPSRYVVITSSNDFSTFVLPQPNPAAMSWFDVAVWRSGGGRVFLKWAGYWDNTWTRLVNDPAAVIRGQ